MSSSLFKQRKDKILALLNAPAEQYTDLSPKGSLDEGIRELVNHINSIEGLVTTSSCAGRTSVFLEGAKKISKPIGEDKPASSASTAIAGPGGKGGGRWLFVSHDPIAIPLGDGSESAHFRNILGMSSDKSREGASFDAQKSLVHFKFEAMVRLTQKLQSCSWLTFSDLTYHDCFS